MLSTPKLVNDELVSYRDYVEHYLPFNVRPQVALDRCVKTRTRQALVGTFVDHAVPLRTALRSGQGIGMLFSLFESSLRGFRAQPLAGQQTPQPDMLEGFVSARMQVEKWTGNRST
jgi:hypothetical protein